MANRLTLNFDGIGQVMRDAGIRAALANKAEEIATAARSLNTTEHVKATVGVEHGTNPLGRPYSRITSTAGAAEFGTSITARRRVLGRAAEQRS